MIPSFENLLIFLPAVLVLVVSPGPANLYVTARTVAQGWRGGLMASFGLALGGLVHVAAAALGLSVIFQYSPLLYTIVKIAGALYLIWLGITLLRAKSSAGADQDAPAGQVKSDRRILMESALVEVLNPKVALFYLAFLPQFVEPEAGSVALQMLFLGGIVTFAAWISDLVYAFLASRAASRLRKSEKARHLLDRVSGTALVGLGAWMAASVRN